MMAPRTPARTSTDGAHAPGLLGNLPLTETDRRIISHLQQDGRRTFAAIAQDIGVTEKTVRTRARALLDQKVIEIVALVSPVALGYSVSALAAITIDSPALGSRISDTLARIDTIDYVVLTYSRYAIFAEIIARDMQELQTTIETEIGAIEGITGVELFPYFSLHYQQARIIDTGSEGDDGVRDIELGATDKAIASQLSLDGRMPFSAVADHLGVSEGQIRQRVQAMIENRQLQIMAILNPLKLLDRTMAWIAIKVSSDTRLRQVADALSTMPDISYVAICAGRFDIFAEAITTTQSGLLDLVETKVRPLNGIRDAEVFIYANLHYKRLLPVHLKDRTGTPHDEPIHSIYES